MFSNDPAWAARLSDPESGPEKSYHVQIDQRPSEALLENLRRGVLLEGERLTVRSVRCLRTGSKHAWLEIVLREGRNRHIRRLLSHFGVSVLRLVRVRVGALLLGELAKGQWRILSDQEIRSLCP